MTSEKPEYKTQISVLEKFQENRKTLAERLKEDDIVLFPGRITRVGVESDEINQNVEFRGNTLIYGESDIGLRVRVRINPKKSNLVIEVLYSYSPILDRDWGHKKRNDQISLLEDEVTKLGEEYVDRDVLCLKAIGEKYGSSHISISDGRTSAFGCFGVYDINNLSFIPFHRNILNFDNRIVAIRTYEGNSEKLFNAFFYVTGLNNFFKPKYAPDPKRECLISMENVRIMDEPE